MVINVTLPEGGRKLTRLTGRIPLHAMSQLRLAHGRSVVSRIVAAVLGGYLFTTIFSTFLARLLGFTPVEAVMSALLVSFLLYAAAIMWVFAARTATRAWLHTWTGLVVGWVLFFVFLTGTAAYFDTEIDRWMQPERPLNGAQLAVTLLARVSAGGGRHACLRGAGRGTVAVTYRVQEPRFGWRLTLMNRN